MLETIVLLDMLLPIMPFLIAALGAGATLLTIASAYYLIRTVESAYWFVVGVRNNGKRSEV